MLQGPDLAFSGAAFGCQAIRNSCSAAGIDQPDLLPQAHCLLVGEAILEDEGIPGEEKRPNFGLYRALDLAWETSKRLDALVEDAGP